MQVAVYTSLTGPAGVEIREQCEPQPGPAEAVIDMRAASVNYHDLRMLSGESSWLDEDDLPYISGADLAGVVSEVGEAVTDVHPGDRVVLCPIQTCGVCRYCRAGPENRCPDLDVFHGAFAERVSVPADRLVALPKKTSFVQAAALPVAYMTAWYMIQQADVTAGDRVLVPGATGGVGVAAIQLLNVVGAQTIGTTTASEKMTPLSELGADHTIQVETPEELHEKVTGIGLVDAAVNHLGGAYVDAALRTLRRGGTMAVCGRTTGELSEINIRNHYVHHRSLVGSTVGTQADLERLVGLVADGTLNPVVNEVFSLDSLSEAFTRLERRRHVGKTVIQS